MVLNTGRIILIEEGNTQGIVATFRKHQISISLFYKWRDKSALKGKPGLAHGEAALTAEVRRLIAENQRLKKLLAEKELMLDIKEELLKKVYQRLQNAP